jgi:hypothetical protein
VRRRGGEEERRRGDDTRCALRTVARLRAVFHTVRAGGDSLARCEPQTPALRCRYRTQQHQRWALPCSPSSSSKNGARTAFHHCRRFLGEFSAQKKFPPKKTENSTTARADALRTLLAAVVASTLFCSPLAAPALRPPPRMTELTFDRAGYVDLLRKLIGENRNLQNNPPTNVPQEDLASDHVLRALGTNL